MGRGFQFNMLGSLEVWCDGRLIPIGSAKQRALLAALLIDANQVVSIDTLMSRLWDDRAPDGARNTLQNYVLRLRRTLGGADGSGGPLSTHPAGYRLDVDDSSRDLDRFEALMADARRLAALGDKVRAAVLSRRATELWRARPLLDVPSEKLQRDVLPALAEKRVNAIEFRIDLEIELGRHADVLPELRELTAAYPLRERFWAQRILSLYRAGRQGEALRCYHDICGVLSDELGVGPGAELTDLFQRMLLADPELLHCEVPEPRRATAEPSRRDVAGNLPAETSAFIGRRKELAQLGRLLESGRLVSLTGVGGVGKSRLALRYAAQEAEAFGGGVWVTDLASWTGQGSIDQALVAALGLRAESGRGDRSTVVEHLRGERSLLVLDNCESAVDDIAVLVTELLRALPELRIVVTSRHRLGRLGEQVMVVAPMTVPPSTVDRGPLVGYESVDLLLNRAAAAVPGFPRNRFDWRDVQALCERLDGVPLAIELAAMRLSVVSLRDAVEWPGSRFELLDGGSSSSSLRRSVERSWDLCTEPERLMWTRLAAISGEFGLRRAADACAGRGIARGEVVELLAGLVHKSVLRADTSGLRTRYRMLGMIQEYGRLRWADVVALNPRGPRLRSVSER
jgi:predicted ATPase/DNA-binding SARP family transcriptional activator